MSRAKKWLSVALWIFVAGLLVNIGRTTLSRLKVRARSKTPFAYTAILKETMFDAEGNAKPAMTDTWAVNSNGSEVIRLENTNSKAPRSERIIDLASGEKVIVDDIHGAKSTTKYGNSNPNSWVRDQNSGCTTFVNGQPTGDETVAGNETVHGYRTVKIIRDKTALWYALDYGCALVKDTVNWGDSRTEQDLVTLIPGEPSANLFAISNSFQEQPPSKLACIFASGDEFKVKGHQCVVPSETAEKMDRQYYAHHTQE